MSLQDHIIKLCFGAGWKLDTFKACFELGYVLDAALEFVLNLVLLRLFAHPLICFFHRVFSC